MAVDDLGLFDRTVARKFINDMLKKYWPTILTLFGGLVTFLVPSLSAEVSAHPKTLVGILCGCIIAAYHANSPNQKTEKGGNGSE